MYDSCVRINLIEDGCDVIAGGLILAHKRVTCWSSEAMRRNNHRRFRPNLRFFNFTNPKFYNLEQSTWVSLIFVSVPKTPVILIRD